MCVCSSCRIDICFCRAAATQNTIPNEDDTPHRKCFIVYGDVMIRDIISKLVRTRMDRLNLLYMTQGITSSQSLFVSRCATLDRLLSVTRLTTWIDLFCWYVNWMGDRLNSRGNWHGDSSPSVGEYEWQMEMADWLWLAVECKEWHAI